MSLVVVAASRNLPVTSGIGLYLLDLVKGSSMVRIRGNLLGTPSSKIEAEARYISQLYGKGCEVVIPKGRTRSEVYFRDWALVKGASRVVTFFDPSRVMLGGTAHVVHAALQYDMPVTAYSVNQDGDLFEVGSYEGDEDLLVAAVLEAAFVQWDRIDRARHPFTPDFSATSWETIDHIVSRNPSVLPTSLSSLKQS